MSTVFILRQLQLFSNDFISFHVQYNDIKKNLVYPLNIGKDRVRRSTRPTDKHTILIY